MTSFGELAIVLNPNAGRGRQRAQVERLREQAAGRGAVFDTGEEGLTEAVAQGVRERRVATVAVVGGDGTLSRVLSSLRRAYGDERLPRIALLRGGTMNTVANALEVPHGSPEKLLARLLANPAGPVLERSTLEVDGRVGFLLSAGVMVGFLDTLACSPGRGKVAALRLLARSSVESMMGGDLIKRIETPLTATLKIDDESHPVRRYVALGAGTVPEVGLGFRPYPRCAERSDSFQVFAFHGSVQTLARELPRIRRGQAVTEALGFAPLARALTVAVEGAGIRYALDGEVYESEGPLRVESGPGVRIVVL